MADVRADARRPTTIRALIVRRNVWYLAITVVLIVGTFVATLASGNTPVLGLDLQGGISVVLVARSGKFSAGSLDIARRHHQHRVNGLGVAEPEITRQGNNIVVDLPGVKDRDKADAGRRQDRGAALPAGARRAAAGSDEDARRPPRSRRGTTTSRRRRGADDHHDDRAASTTATPQRSRRATARRSRAATDDPDHAALADDKRNKCVALQIRNGDGATPARPDESHRQGRRRREVAASSGRGLHRRHDAQRRRPDEVQQARRGVVPQDAAAERGRDRARRRRPVDPGVPEPPTSPATSQISGNFSHDDADRTSRRVHQLRRAAGAAQAADRTERLADARQGPAQRRDRRRA